MYRVVHTQGRRGTASFPAPDHAGAEGIVRALIGDLLRQGRARDYQRMRDRENNKIPAWLIIGGHCDGDLIQIIETQERQAPTSYNMVATVASADKGDSKQDKRREAWQRTMTALDQHRALARQDVKPVEECKVCKGQGTQPVPVRFIQPNFPTIVKPVCQTVLCPVLCRECNGTGKADGRMLGRVAGLARGMFRAEWPLTRLERE